MRLITVVKQNKEITNRSISSLTSLVKTPERPFKELLVITGRKSTNISKSPLTSIITILKISLIFPKKICENLPHLTDQASAIILPEP